MNEKPNPYDNLYNKPNSYGSLYPPPPAAKETPGEPTAPDVPPQPFVMHSDEVEAPSLPQNPANAYSYPPPQVRTLPPPVPKKPKAPFSPIPLLLLAGVAFLFLGGIIFLTNTWDMLPDAARAFSLFSAGIVAFGANALAERVFKLPKTGLAFYVLGCIFLPLAMAGVGAFALLGDWFSYQGEGVHLVWSLVFVCVAAPALFGERHYKSAILAWFGLSGIGAAWFWLSFFISVQLPLYSDTQEGVIGFLLVLFAAGATIWSVWYGHRKQDTPICKAMTAFLYPLLAVYTVTLIAFALDISFDFPKGASLLTFVLLLVMAVLFSNSQFAAGKFHAGIFGIVPCLYTAFAHFTTISDQFSDNGFVEFLFCSAMTALVLFGTIWFRRLHEALRATSTVVGVILSMPLIMFGSGYALFSADNIHSGFLAFLYLLLVVGLVFFGIEKTNPLSNDTLIFCIQLVALFVGVEMVYMERGIMVLLLAVGALLLLAEAFVGRKLWPLVLAIGSCTAVLMQHLPEPMIWFCWFCTACFLTGVVYAHFCRRWLLEKCCAWAGIAMLLTSLGMTLDQFLGTEILWVLLLSAVTLLYLLEAVVFWKHSRAEATARYLEVISLFVSAIAFIAFVSRHDVSAALGVLLLLVLGVFTIVFLRKPKNFLSVPYLVMFFFSARHMVVSLETNAVIENVTLLHAAQIGSFILILAVFAAMGRILLPEGFCDRTDGRFQVDFALLAGVFPVFSVSETIDWYPQILTALFLSLYSLLYIGRVKNRSVPTLLASFFGCLTIFFHNVYDPWTIMESLRELEIKTPQIILYVLPLHLFILSLLWILPKKCKSGVHVARFCMYCFTMLCLLASSFTFGHVTDALILVLFSFAILVGSFFIKRLRWFTLGFSVLLVMTFRMTRMFWQSLHWSIYLFLAGAVLIGIASAYELNARKQAEHPDEPKKKFKPFSTWRW